MKVRGWRPRIERVKEFNPFEALAAEDEYLMNAPKLRSKDDTAPLQGTKDVSDADSLEDVIAETPQSSA
jgi:hypothetical protein